MADGFFFFFLIWLCWVLVAAHGIFIAVCRLLLPDQELNLGPCIESTES